MATSRHLEHSRQRRREKKSMLVYYFALVLVCKQKVACIFFVHNYRCTNTANSHVVSSAPTEYFHIFWLCLIIFITSKFLYSQRLTFPLILYIFHGIRMLSLDVVLIVVGAAAFFSFRHLHWVTIFFLHSAIISSQPFFSHFFSSWKIHIFCVI